MKYRKLGPSDLYVSEIGLGCMSLPADEAEAIRILHAAFDAGVNFFDTADLYQHGRNEEVVGRAFKDRRDKVILATKVGNRWRPDGSGWDWDPSKAYIKQAVYESLRRLGTDYIDLYQLHGGTIDDPVDETIEAFEELKQAGVIRWYGISSIRPNVIRTWVAKSRMVSVMMQYSILDRRPEEEMLDLLARHGIAVIARGPVARGLLSARTLQPDVDVPAYLGHTPEEILRLVERLQGLTLPNRTLAQTALRYALAHPAVATVIPGASRIEQLQENLGAAGAPELTAEELAQIRSWIKAEVYTQHR
ncbi:putative oxidoreductase YqkF [Alicyclobacillus cellulosilyticus]|uniref:Oxidoreductase YqkF n=1 Tax=Alicyclobacillus cellulosilyticus TaxID=1003997 RepID=A0A917K9C1_9BACL|nr:aldo/keto reductase [Alicyclobacillus cellulosilyticus]GGJ03496.1 putative oxidoreductase YqkF [Alicyclobacillus cellulosilyticus]